MTASFIIVEDFTAGKNPAFNDDCWLETAHGIIVIDGVTQEGPSPVPDILKTDVLPFLATDATERDFARLAAAAIEAKLGAPQKNERMSGATAAVLSFHHQQLWLYGDVGAILIKDDGSHTLHTTPHDWEMPVFEGRKLLNELMLASGELVEDDLYTQDPGRDMMAPIRKRQHNLANKPGGYAVLGATLVPEELVVKVDITFDIASLILMTDGYPFHLMSLEDVQTLDAAEAAHQRISEADPHCMNENLGPKGMKRDPATGKLMPYDDRTYVRILRMDFS